MDFKQLFKQKPAALSPMSDICDVAFRRLCYNYGSAISTIPLINAKAILMGNPVTMKSLEPKYDKGPIGLQLFGTEQEDFSKAIESLKHDYDFIDINLGCPATKVIKIGAGSELLKDMKKTEAILKACVNASEIPITAKIRIGIKQKFRNIKKTAALLENTGIEALSVHARTQKQGYSGTADWEMIRAFADNMNIPVIGNGDINSLDDAKEKIKEYSVCGTLIGRAARKNPCVFSGNNHKKEYLLKKYIYYAKKFNYLNLKKTRLIASGLISGEANATKIRSAINKAESIDEITQRFIS